MLKVFKYTQEVVDYFTLALPKDSKVLSVSEVSAQNEFNIWALVNPHNETEDRNFRFVGSGHELGVEEEKLKFIGTCATEDRPLFGHLFEILG